MGLTFVAALINDIGQLKDIHPLPERSNLFIGKWKRKLAVRWNDHLRFQCREVWNIICEARRSFLLDGCLNLSAALAFYAILSFIPFVFLLVWGATYVLGSSESSLRMTLTVLTQVFPHAGSLIFEEIKAFPQKAGVMGLAGFLSMLWAASVIFSSLEYAMGVVFRVEQRRSFLKSRLFALSMVPASALVFLLSFSVTGYLFPYLILTMDFAAIYKFIPNTPVSFRHALAGGASCAFFFELAKHLFACYIRNYGHFGVTHGTLEAMIILVLWSFYSACILLFCAEVVSAYRRKDITLLAQAFT
jgi:membrane protein